MAISFVHAKPPLHLKKVHHPIKYAKNHPIKIHRPIYHHKPIFRTRKVLLLPLLKPIKARPITSSVAVVVHTNPQPIPTPIIDPIPPPITVPPSENEPQTPSNHIV